MKFILFFSGQPRQPEQSEHKKIAELWADWFDFLAKRGVFESVLPYNKTGKMVTDEKISSFSDSHKYYGCMINVRSEKEAIAVARKMPFVSFGGSIIVKQCVDVARD